MEGLIGLFIFFWIIGVASGTRVSGPVDKKTNLSGGDINPATGLPMNDPGGTDIAGNPYGTNITFNDDNSLGGNSFGGGFGF